MNCYLTSFIKQYNTESLLCTWYYFRPENPLVNHMEETRGYPNFLKQGAREVAECSKETASRAKCSGFKSELYNSSAACS